MNYIQNANEIIKEYATTHKDFAANYEDGPNFRELCDILTAAPVDYIRAYRNHLLETIK